MNKYNKVYEDLERSIDRENRQEHFIESLIMLPLVILLAAGIMLIPMLIIWEQGAKFFALSLLGVALIIMVIMAFLILSAVLGQIIDDIKERPR